MLLFPFFPYGGIHTGVTWWGLVLVILGSAALCGFVAYFFVCRRMQARSRSEDFSSKVITAPDTPWMRTGSEGSITTFTVGGGGSSSRGGPSSPSTGGASSPLARSVRRARSASKHDSGQRDFRQALMHDDEEARDILIRSSVLYAEDNNVDDVDAATTAGGRTTMTTARPGAYAPPPVINHPPPGETAAAAGR
jgi:hypothetical protein